MACVTGASSSDSINERLRHDPLVGIMANVKSNFARRGGFVLLLQVALLDSDRMNGKQHISTNDGQPWRQSVKYIANVEVRRAKI